MITLSKLPKTTKKSGKRLGRGLGSGRGAKSTKGTKRHQKAREKIPTWFEGGQNPITKKFPLLRGKGKNKSVHHHAIPVSVKLLDKLPKDSEVDIELLVKYRIVGKDAFKRGVKILANGDISKAYNVKLPVSTQAKTKIEKAGGKVLEK